MILKYVHKKSGNPVAENVFQANSFWFRLKGLMMKEKLAPYDGLILQPCNSIHTFFMKFSIDVLFLDRNLNIVKIFRELRPWRMTWMYPKAIKVLELTGGTLDSDIQVGDQLEEVCIN